MAYLEKLSICRYFIDTYIFPILIVSFFAGLLLGVFFVGIFVGVFVGVFFGVVAGLDEAELDLLLPGFSFNLPRVTVFLKRQE